MQRIPEKELMDEDSQALAYSEADFAAPHDACADAFASWWHSDPPRAACRSPRILDLGCGPADVTVRLARRLPHATFVAVDGSAAMLHQARLRLSRLMHDDRIQLVHSVLPTTAALPGPFDAVFSNSLLHHLHDPQVLWASIQQHAPQAPFFVMDLMRPADAITVDNLVALHAAGAPEVLRHDFRASLFAAFSLAEVREQLIAASLRGEVLATSDRHLLACSP